MTSGRVLSRADDLAWVVGVDRVSVLACGDLSQPVVTLDGTAAEIWLRLDAPVLDTLLVEELALDFGADVSQVAIDVARWVDDAVRRGIVVVGTA